MKSVFYANVDGYDICLGFSDAVVDPVGTSIIIAEDLRSSDEAKAVAALNSQIDALHQRQRFASSQATVDALQAQINELAQGYPSLDAKLSARRSALMAMKAVYFNPGSGENLVTDEQAAKLLALQGHNLKVKLDGTTIADWRGTSYWQVVNGRLTNTMITKLGDTVPSDVVLDADLTDDDKTAIAIQFEADRVAALTDDQKSAEAQAAQAQAKAAVATVQSEVTAGVSTQADLTAALSAYQAALAAINSKYGVILS